MHRERTDWRQSRGEATGFAWVATVLVANVASLRPPSLLLPSVPARSHGVAAKEGEGAVRRRVAEQHEKAVTTLSRGIWWAMVDRYPGHCKAHHDSSNALLFSYESSS